MKELFELLEKLQEKAGTEEGLTKEEQKELAKVLQLAKKMNEDHKTEITTLKTKKNEEIQTTSTKAKTLEERLATLETEIQSERSAKAELETRAKRNETMQAIETMLKKDSIELPGLVKDSLLSKMKIDNESKKMYIEYNSKTLTADEFAQEFSKSEDSKFFKKLSSSAGTGSGQIVEPSRRTTTDKLKYF